jgi:hypothetical protein
MSVGNVLSGYILSGEIKYYILRYNLSSLKQKAENMFKRAEMNGQNCQNEQVKAREEMDNTLRKLQVLRGKISELRAQCEELRKLGSKTESNGLLCSQCGESIEPGQEIVVKSPNETEKKYYHKECFKSLWTSTA